MCTRWALGENWVRIDISFLLGPWWIWINTSCEFIMNDCITTTKQSTTKPCAYFLGYTVIVPQSHHMASWNLFNIVFRWWIVAWRQSIAWTNIDRSSIGPCGIHRRAAISPRYQLLRHVWKLHICLNIIIHISSGGGDGVGVCVCVRGINGFTQLSTLQTQHFALQIDISQLYGGF